MLNDKQIEEIARPYIRWIGGYWEHEEGIPERDIEDFARAVEQAILQGAPAND